MNKRPWFASALLATALIASGCGAEENDEAFDMTNPNESYNKISYGFGDRNNENFSYTSKSGNEYDNNVTNRVGYVRYNKDQVANDESENRYAVMDREQASDLVSRMLLRTKGFEDVATVVTDAEVLVGYKYEGNQNKNYAADIAKKTAQSVLPRYYEVYVSDTEETFDDLEALSTKNLQQKTYRDDVESVVKKMKKSPQGEDTYNDETRSFKDKRDVADDEEMRTDEMKNEKLNMQ
ncbi:hypothetical protein N781_07700 [Pontibacillus halophilus JSM 076056 = DSM 19796]|uniref:Sporulation protein n=1 Tax=Pontibacillus halophilus JSM 076056 = DSM 19796 TaxID=1385510 RepID=A0A0A5GEJ5_9BACI|nr:YhcN/YlaJ family sporulation lipoprotein [Pontibacillus halophilus]KGX89638.1 hypothetical protein N781_07700 [Pontibacillus halophilus JSM 076056 = DSM 19796]